MLKPANSRIFLCMLRKLYIFISTADILEQMSGQLIQQQHLMFFLSYKKCHIFVNIQKGYTMRWLPITRYSPLCLPRLRPKMDSHARAFVPFSDYIFLIFWYLIILFHFFSHFVPLFLSLKVDSQSTFVLFSDYTCLIS